MADPTLVRLVFPPLEEGQAWAGFGFADRHALSFAISAAKYANLSVRHVVGFFAGMMNGQSTGLCPNNFIDDRGAQTRSDNWAG